MQVSTERLHTRIFHEIHCSLAERSLAGNEILFKKLEKARQPSQAGVQMEIGDCKRKSKRAP
jgi:hypothetical protein